MRIIKSLLLVFALISITENLSAHAMWIETNAVGKIGKQQEMKIFFGEYSTGDISPTDKWFSDLKDFTLVLVTPGKQEIKLIASANKEYYSASFTPETEGVYTVVMHQLAKDVYRNMKLDYHSSATVTVGKNIVTDSASANNNFVSAAVSGIVHKMNEQVSVKIFSNAKPAAARQKVKIVAPNGWEKELLTDSRRELEFVPLWPGKYMVDYALIEKTPGEHNGKKFEEVWKIATLMVDVR